MSGVRSPKEIIESHLMLRREGAIEQDIELNFAEAVTIIDASRIYRGHDGVRASSRMLSNSIPGAEFVYGRVAIDGCAGYLLWSAKAKKVIVEEGVNSFFVHDGMIVAQTIHYRVKGI
jgi:hypothetical protein